MSTFSVLTGSFTSSQQEKAKEDPVIFRSPYLDSQSLEINYDRQHGGLAMEYGYGGNVYESLRSPTSASAEYAHAQHHKKICPFKEHVVDECYRSRFYARALEYYLVEVDGQTTQKVRCPMSNCPGVFDDAKQMLRHLKGCDSFPRGSYECPICNKIEKFRTVSEKRCSWKRTSFGKIMQNLVRRLSGSSRPSQCPNCQYPLGMGSKVDPAKYQEPSPTGTGRSSNASTAEMNSQFYRSPSGHAISGDEKISAPQYNRIPEMDVWEYSHELDPMGVCEADTIPALPELPTASEPALSVITDKSLHLVHEIPDSSRFTSMKSSPTDISSASTSQIDNYSTDISPTSSTGITSADQSPNGKMPQQYLGIRGNWQIPNTQSHHATAATQYRRNAAPIKRTQSKPVSSAQKGAVPLPLLDTDFLTSELQAATWGPDYTNLHSGIADFVTPQSALYAQTLTPVSSGMLFDSFLPTPFNESPSSQSTRSFASSESQSSEKPKNSFKCPYPDCNFVPHGIEGNFQGYLRKHMKNHEESRYECPAEGCDKVYTRPDNVTQHVKKSHAGPFRVLERKRHVSNASLQQSRKKNHGQTLATMDVSP